MKKRYFLNFSYLGGQYRGSQKHTTDGILDVDSIQGTLEASLWRIWSNLVEPPKVVLAGRTDAGVHALYMTAHVDLEHKSRFTHFDSHKLLKMINRHLIKCNDEIRVFSFYEVSPDFHARFSAKSRSYMYRFCVAKDLTDKRIPIVEFGKTMHVSAPKFDIEKVKHGIKLFQGRRDFKTFTNKAVLDAKEYDSERYLNFVRTMDVSFQESSPFLPADPLSNNFNFYNLFFTSTAFLYNQIRRITGSLIALATGKITEDDIKFMLQVPSHDHWMNCIYPAQPHGLYLMNIVYDKELIRNIGS